MSEQLEALSAQSIAIEHVFWALKENERTRPADVLPFFELYWTGPRAPDWHDCVMMLSIEWTRLQTKQTPPKLRRVA